MSETESALFADLIMGSYLWAGVPADVFVTPRTIQQARRDKAKMCEYHHRIKVEQLADAQAQLQDLDLAARQKKELRENPVGHGRGMVRRADKYLAQQHGKEPSRASGPVSAPPMFLDPEEDDASVSSDSTYQSNGHDTDRTRRTNISNRNHTRNQRKWKEHRFRHPTNAKKEEDRRKEKVVLSLFRDSPKEGTLTYTDWCQEVEEYLRKGYNDNRVKDAMLSSVEGQAYVNFRSCDEGRNCTPT